jgi:hypothetical protein
VFAALWVASLIRGYGLNVYTEVLGPPTYSSHQRAAASNRGRLWLAYVRAEVVEESARRERRLRVHAAPLPRGEPVARHDAPAWLARLGIDWSRKSTSTFDAQGHYVYRELALCMPYWLLVVMTGGAGWWIGRRPRLVRGRIKRGLCVACGYDLRATPGRCPECGYESPPTDTARRSHPEVLRGTS